MRKLPLAAAALLALSASGNAAVIADLGVNPTSSQGDFSNSVGGGLFSDQFTFQLVGGPQFLAIASVTNVFANPTDFITNFTASLFQDMGPPGPGGGDMLVVGPVAASPCGIIPNCQFAAGSGILNPGNYYLQFAGTGGGTSGYGGNLSVAAGFFPIPGPIVGAGIPGLLAAFGLLGLNRWRRRREQAV
jgi:hypothetical protein